MLCTVKPLPIVPLSMVFLQLSSISSSHEKSPIWTTYYCIRCTVPLSVVLLCQWLIIFGPDPTLFPERSFLQKNCNSNIMSWKVNSGNLVPTISAVMVLMECHYALGKWRMLVKQRGWGDAQDINTNENVILFTPIRKARPSLYRFSQNSWKLHSVILKYFIPNFI
jgi:hypothetical protein